MRTLNGFGESFIIRLVPGRVIPGSCFKQMADCLRLKNKQVPH